MNLLFIFIFSLPILLLRIFTAKEGELYHFITIDIYSQGLDASIIILLRLFVLSTAVFIIFKVIYLFEEMKKELETLEKQTEGRRSVPKWLAEMLAIFFLSIEYFQRLLKDFFTQIPNITKLKQSNKTNISAAIDKLYQEINKP